MGANVGLPSWEERGWQPPDGRASQEGSQEAESLYSAKAGCQCTLLGQKGWYEEPPKQQGDPPETHVRLIETKTAEQ